MSTIKPLLRRCQHRLTSRQSCVSKASHRRYLFNKPVDHASETSGKTRSRVEKINSRLPRFLQQYTKPLITAPVTHISAFLLLHELTAVVPLLGLAGIFHYTRWLPPYISEAKWVSTGVEKFGRYFRRKGWLGEEGVARRDRYWGLSEKGVRVVVEFATAWAITKALLPARLILSVWATPWFARVAIVPSANLIKRLFGKKASIPPTSAAAGTGVTAAGVVPKSSTKP